MNITTNINSNSNHIQQSNNSQINSTVSTMRDMWAKHRENMQEEEHMINFNIVTTSPEKASHTYTLNI